MEPLTANNPACLFPLVYIEKGLTKQTAMHCLKMLAQRAPRGELQLILQPHGEKALDPVAYRLGSAKGSVVQPTEGYDKRHHTREFFLHSDGQPTDENNSKSYT
jgi:hypothetical protein